MSRSPSSAGTPWRIVALLCATATAGYMCRVNVSTAGALLMEEFGLTQVAMGGVFSAFLLGYAFFQVPAGMLADRFGARRVLAVAAWLWVGATLMQVLVGVGPFQGGLGGVLGMFIAWRFLLGVSESPTYPGAAEGVSRWVLPGWQARANGIIIGSIGLGSALAPPLVSNVMVRWGWRAALLASAIPALAVALIWLRVKEPPRAASGAPAGPPPPDAAAPATAAPRLRTRSFALLTASYTLQGYVGYIFVSWFYLYLVQERGFDLIRGAWWSSLPWVLSIVSIPLGGWVADRLTAGRLGAVWGRRAVPIFGMAGSGVLISVGAHTGSAVLAAVALAFATALVLCVEGPFWAMMMRVSGSRSGTAGGIMNMGSNLGGLVSPALTPLLATWIGWEAALHIAAARAGGAALLWLGIRPEAPAVSEPGS
ncbi:MAG: MFS transporter [Gemmatimonadetes bacterium]|nr:MFS transporter [Gemmatimonadota bacterium]